MPTKEAIQDGAEEAIPTDVDPVDVTDVDDVVEPVEPAPNPREATMDNISKRRQAELAAEADSQPGEDITSKMQNIIASGIEDGVNKFGDEIAEPVDEVVEVDEDVDDDEEEILEADDAADEPEVDDTPITVKVNGEERTVTEAEIREYQKQVAADKRLEALNAREAQLEQREQALKAAPPPAVPEVPEEAAEELIQAVFSEDKEATAEALKKVVSSGQQPAQAAVNTDQAVEEALYKRDVVKAQNSFYKNHPKLAGDFLGRVNTKTEEVQSANPDYTPSEIIEEAANLVYSDLKSEFGLDLRSKGNTTQVPPGGKKGEKVTRKRKVVPMARKSVSARANIDRSKPAPQTASDYVKEMQMSRGQRPRSAQR